MKDYRLILSVLWKNKSRGGKNGLRKQDGAFNVPMLIAFVFGIGVIVVMLAVVGYISGVSSKVSGAGVAMLASICTATQVITLLFGATTIFSVMFLSDDNEFLLSLPVSHTATFYAKLTIVYLNELMITAVCLLPVMIAFGIGYGVSGGVAALFYLVTPLVVVTAPVLPLVVVSILAVPLMYVVSFFRKRAALTTILAVLLLGGAMVGYMLIFLGDNSLMAGATGGLSDGFKKAVEIISYIFYPNRAVMSVALGEKALMNAGIFIASIGVLLVISVLICSRFYKRGMSAQVEGQAGSGKKGVDIKENKAVTSLLIRDFKNLMRNPGFAINSIVGLFMAPLITLIMGFTTAGIGVGGVGTGGAEGSLISEQLLNVALAMMYFLLLACGMNYVAGLSFTREGKTFYILRYLPVTKDQIIKSKNLFADLASLVSCVLMVACAAAFYHLDAWNIVLMLISCMMYAKAFNLWLLYRDMKRPNLVWNNVNEAIKRNYYIIIPMFGGMAVGIVSIVISVVLMTAGGYMGATVQSVIFWATQLVISLGMMIFFMRFVKARSSELFSKIGDSENTFLKNDKKENTFLKIK